MTKTEIRKALAEAANDVEGVSCTEYFVQDTAPGRAWIRWDRNEWPDAFGAIGWWNVVVLLPQDLAAAERFAEDHLDQLVAALAPHMVVKSAQPQRINIDGVGLLPALFINGHREE